MKNVDERFFRLLNKQLGMRIFSHAQFDASIRFGISVSSAEVFYFLKSGWILSPNILCEALPHPRMIWAAKSLGTKTQQHEQLNISEILVSKKTQNPIHSPKPPSLIAFADCPWLYKPVFWLYESYMSNTCVKKKTRQFSVLWEQMNGENEESENAFQT